ncbi:MAG TPA: metallopeptidase family protein [Phycisphaerales bacterium]|nr:metallopeptidase family protein [Phycisphaerales bacterium]
MDDASRDRFDAMLERVLGDMPRALLALLDEVPVIVLDEPTAELLQSLGVPREQWEEEAAGLCGLHSGHSVLDHSVEHSGELPEQIHLFRRGIVQMAGGWDRPREIEEEIRVTLLHEIGHHFGLEEDDLDGLGYA